MLKSKYRPSRDSARRSRSTATHTACPAPLLWLRPHFDKWLSHRFNPPDWLHLTLVCFEKNKIKIQIRFKSKQACWPEPAIWIVWAFKVVVMMQNPNRNLPEDTVVSLESSDFLFGRWHGAATQTRETGHSSASGSSSSPSLLSPLLFLPLPSIRWSKLAASHIHKWIEAEWRSNKLNGSLSPEVRQWGGGENVGWSPAEVPLCIVLYMQTCLNSGWWKAVQVAPRWFF